MIALDLEWTHNYKGELNNEIIQIGAVKFTGFDGKIIDTFNVYIHPDVNNKVSNHTLRMLPDADESNNSTLGFVRAYIAFVRWCKDETEFIEWGNSDINELNRNCDHYGLSRLKPERLLNLQRVFSSEVNCAHKQINLEAAALYCNIPTSFEFHNALYDSLYTALVAMHLKSIPKLFWQKPNKKKELHGLKVWRSPLIGTFGLSTIPFVRQPLKYIGPCRSTKDILKNKQGLILKCPICGNTIYAKDWLGNTQVFYSTAKCSEHGKFICKLTIYNISKSEWKGVVSIPLPKEDIILDYMKLQRDRPTQSPRKGDKKRKKLNRNTGKNTKKVKTGKGKTYKHKGS